MEIHIQDEDGKAPAPKKQDRSDWSSGINYIQIPGTVPVTINLSKLFHLLPGHTYTVQVEWLGARAYAKHGEKLLSNVVHVQTRGPVAPKTTVADAADSQLTARDYAMFVPPATGPAEGNIFRAMAFYIAAPQSAVAADECTLRGSIMNLDPTGRRELPEVPGVRYNGLDVHIRDEEGNIPEPTAYAIAHVYTADVPFWGGVDHRNVLPGKPWPVTIELSKLFHLLQGRTYRVQVEWLGARYVSKPGRQFLSNVVEIKTAPAGPPGSANTQH